MVTVSITGPALRPCWRIPRSAQNPRGAVCVAGSGACRLLPVARRQRRVHHGFRDGMSLPRKRSLPAQGYITGLHGSRAEPEPVRRLPRHRPGSCHRDTKNPSAHAGTEAKERILASISSERHFPLAGRGHNGFAATASAPTNSPRLQMCSNRYIGRPRKPMVSRKTVSTKTSFRILFLRSRRRDSGADARHVTCNSTGNSTRHSTGLGAKTAR